MQKKKTRGHGRPQRAKQRMDEERGKTESSAEELRERKRFATNRPFFEKIKTTGRRAERKPHCKTKTRGHGRPQIAKQRMDEERGKNRKFSGEIKRRKNSCY